MYRSRSLSDIILPMVFITNINTISHKAIFTTMGWTLNFITRACMATIANIRKFNSIETNSNWIISLWFWSLPPHTIWYGTIPESTEKWNRIVAKRMIIIPFEAILWEILVCIRYSAKGVWSGEVVIIHWLFNRVRKNYFGFLAIAFYYQFMPDRFIFELW